MDIAQLKTFYTVAKAGSFSKAVKQLNLSQPAISRQVMLLEESLDARLFNRHARRGLVLTNEGEALLERTQTILRDVEALKLSLRTSNEPTGLFKIATSHANAVGWIMLHVAQFMQNHPQVKVQVTCTDQLLDVKQHDADLFIADYQHGLLGYEQTHLQDIHIKFYASPAYIKAHGEPKTPADLTTHRLLALGAKDGLFYSQRDWLVLLNSNSKAAPKPYLTINSVEGLLHAVKAGLGIAGLPEGQHIPTEGLVPVLANQKSPVIGLCCIYPTLAKENVTIKTFIQHLKQTHN